MPMTPSEVESGRSVSVTLRVTAEAGTAASSCQPNMPVTLSPGAKPGCSEATTSPEAMERMTSPMPTGWA